MANYMFSMFSVQVALQLASTHPTLAGAIANLGTSSATANLQEVYLVCRRLPGVLNRRWGAGAASALADEADRLYVERRRLLCVD
jgi:hypothetical protein